MNIVVVGASRGLGFCLVDRFAKEGHRLVASVRDINNERLNSLSKTYKDIRLMHMDVTDEESIKEAAKRLREEDFTIDLLIHNAGIIVDGDGDKDILGISVDDFRRTLEVNTTGTMIALKYLVPLVDKSGSGQIFLITSEAGSITNSGSNLAAYSVSKAAQNKIAFILKTTLASSCRVLAIHPGRMRTDMGGPYSEIDPEEAAEGIYRLATNKTEVRQGSSIFIDYKGQEMQI